MFGTLPEASFFPHGVGIINLTFPEVIRFIVFRDFTHHTARISNSYNIWRYF